MSHQQLDGFDVEKLGDFLLQKGIPGEVVLSFTGILLWLRCS